MGPGGRTPRYRGELGETSLPEMLATIERFGVPGVISAHQGTVVKRIFLRDGLILHASSSDRDDSLGHHLRRAGLLSEAQFVEVMRERRGSQSRLGVLVVERGLLSPEVVYEHIRRQIEAIVWSLFGWQQGEVTFRPGELEIAGEIRIQIPMRRVILKGIRQVEDARSLVARLGGKETVYEPTFRVEHLIEVGLDAEEHELLRLVDGERSLYTLCSEGPLSPAVNAKLLYAFRVLELVRPLPDQDAEQRSGPIKIRFNTVGDKFKA